VNTRPIIGILTQPDASEGGEYIAASYLKFVESAGARAVPVRFKADEAELRRTFNAINGLLLPGGAADLEPGHKYFDASEKLFGWALEANKKNTVFPIWGTCLGFEQLNVLAAGSNYTVLKASGDYDAEDFPAPVHFTDKAASSEMFGNMPDWLQKSIQQDSITFNAHASGIHPDVFASNPTLSGFFNDLATFHDRKGRQFVAAVEAKNGLPIYAVQFHPEKSVFEWHLPSNIPHQSNAVYLSQYLGNLFVSKARCNTHQYPGGFEEAQTQLVEAIGSRVVNTSAYFTEVYLFSK